MPERVAVSTVSPLTQRVRRLRVPLGFVCGAFVLGLATPTWGTLGAGSVIAMLGEAFRLWAAGHLDKSSEVTTSGPYRWTAHPLYVGSSVMGLGLAVASAQLLAGLVVALYLGITLPATIRAEEAFLRARFGGEYDAYRDGRGAGADRRFSLARVAANREYRAVMGLGAAMALLALKVLWRRAG